MMRWFWGLCMLCDAWGNATKSHRRVGVELCGGFRPSATDYGGIFRFCFAQRMHSGTAHPLVSVSCRLQHSNPRNGRKRVPRGRPPLFCCRSLHYVWCSATPRSPPYSVAAATLFCPFFCTLWCALGSTCHWERCCLGCKGAQPPRVLHADTTCVSFFWYWGSSAGCGAVWCCCGTSAGLVPNLGATAALWGSKHTVLCTARHTAACCRQCFCHISLLFAAVHCPHWTLMYTLYPTAALCKVSASARVCAVL